MCIWDMRISFAAAVFMFVGLNFMYCTKYSWVAEVPANPDVKRLVNGSQHIVYKKERKQEKNHVLRDLKKKSLFFFYWHILFLRQLVSRMYVKYQHTYQCLLCLFVNSFCC